MLLFVVCCSLTGGLCVLFVSDVLRFAASLVRAVHKSLCVGMIGSLCAVCCVCLMLYIVVQ